MPIKVDIEQNNKLLTKIFDFTSADLEANAVGLITPKQKAQLEIFYQQEKSRVFREETVTAILMVVPLFLGLAQVWFILANDRPIWGFQTLLTLGIFLILFFGSYSIFVKWKYVKNMDRQEESIKRVCGSIQPVFTSILAVIKIEGVILPVTFKQYWAFRENFQYCIHFTSENGYILSSQAIALEPNYEIDSWSVEENNQELMRVFKFTQEDLINNQKGRITDNQLKQMKKRLPKFDVKEGCGIVICDIKREWAQYIVEMNDNRFKVSKEQILSFEPGENYCIYFEPNLNRILSANRLE